MNRRPPHARDRFDRNTPARKERANRNRKKPDTASTLRFVLLIALVGQCMRVLFTSPRLKLREVHVTGSQRLSREDVVRLGRLHLGTNIFRVNLVRVSQRLQVDPVIREALVSRDLPNALNVELKERVPALRVVTEESAFDADEEGVVFQKAPDANPDSDAARRLPTVEVLPKDVPPLGQRLSADLARAVRECAQLAREQHVELRKMRVDASGELWLNIEAYPTSQSTGDGLAVRVGRLTDLPEKFRDIHQSLLGKPDLSARATYLNVMCAGWPAYMEANGKLRDSR